MTTPQLTFATYCVWLTILMLGSPAVYAEPPTGEPLTELAVLDALVGSWVCRPHPQVELSARQKCKWILNKQFLEIDTHVIRPGHPPSSWRTLVTYDKSGNCYRQWKFSDNGVVSTEQGAWNEKTSSLKLSGRLPNSNDSKSSVKIFDDNTMEFEVCEFLDEKHTVMSVVAFTLNRIPPTKDRQLTK